MDIFFIILVRLVYTADTQSKPYKSHLIPPILLTDCVGWQSIWPECLVVSM